MSRQTYSPNMIYWPNNPGIDLNRQVAHIFTNLKIKISQNLQNRSSQVLPIDILSPTKKYYVFSIILNELENITLECIASKDNLKQESITSFLTASSHKISCESYISSNNIKIHRRLFNYDSKMVTELANNLTIILNLCSLGASNFSQVIFYPNTLSRRVPYIQIEILFENFIIQASNVVIDALLRTSEGVMFGLENHLFNIRYSSIRTIEQFRNNLMWYKFVYNYIAIPKNIYENKYNVYVISPEGILSKHIFAQRLAELSTLSTTQLVITFIIEIQDFLLPKIYILLQFISKTIFFIIYEPLTITLTKLSKNLSFS
mmetsp:Transcript_16938/g.69130  ORF Transcript_16938/g.69130 Transcript_16938/m.69130 type:complete len:318 (+) Transcript_16938:2875-3828(+)